MKKFLVYVVVIVTLLFLGFTVYYLAQNDETISLTMSTDESYYINKGDVFELPIKWTKPSRGTTLTVSGDNSSVLNYDKDTKMFTGVGGGFTTVTIATSNPNFGPFVLQVYVGDGELNSPFVLSNASDIARIGKDSLFTNSKYYRLINDVDLSTYNNGVWEPLDEFSGHLDGNRHTIYNLKVNNTENGGLFGVVTHSGSVENVRFDKVDISGEFTNVGTVAGVNKGLVGKVEVNGKITNTKTDSNTGLIVGANLWDSSAAYINMCSAKGSLEVKGNAGGLTGYNKSSIILNSRALVTGLTANEAGIAMGGIVGKNESTYDGEEYFAAAVVKCYSVVEAFDGNANIGAVVGVNAENNVSNVLFYNKYEDIYFACAENIVLDAIGGGANLVSATVAQQLNEVTKDDLLSKTTYVNYNFENVWNKIETEYANLNYLGTYEYVYIKGMRKEITLQDQSLIDFLNTIRNTSNESVFIVSEDVTYDLEGIQWETVAKLSSKPMKAGIVVEDGVTCVIKNFILADDNSSFFGYISGNTKVNGITFEDVTVNHLANEMANSAVVATSLLNGATIEGITVKNLAEFKTKSTNVGVIAAQNSANIINCKVVADDIKSVTINPKDAVVNYGTIVGYNDGNVSNCRVNNINLQIDTSRVVKANFNIGGAVGTTTKSITNIGVKAFNLDTNNEGVTYVGGVVGYTTNETITVENCYSLANIYVNIYNTDAYVGGVVSYVSANTEVIGSLFKTGTLKAGNVGGVVAVNNGTVASSYSEGTLRGAFVAGLVARNFGTVENCYTLSSLQGENGSSVVSGLVGLLAKDSVVDRCFSAASFGGEGTKYAETETPFRWNGVTTTVKSWFGSDVSHGTLERCVIINYGNAEVQVNSIFQGKDGWIDATEEDCRGKNDYAVFREKASFGNSVWNFTNNGSYPTLWNVATVD